MNRKKIASALAACALPLAAMHIAAASTAVAAPPPVDCATWVSGPGQTGNVTCTRGGAAGQFRAKVVCRSNSGSSFTVYGDWLYSGVSMATCSLNGSAGVSSIGWELRLKG
ncbi:hypothetical protein QEZ40_000483 [Streptomyces katrae]|uniref:Ig-like domain-containing protein n=1 Tax=Streptomyces katrae TaxID=68223 RepID=A0ABT7GS52_9ACTN|nr:hypothetical protein [Streptomyces katrae]MDK9496141.1 hypothetical protein [Streptomyces katrae]